MPKAKKRSSKTKPKNIELIEEGSVPIYYSNNVECRISNEEVVLSFALRKYSNPEEQADVVHRTYMSIPHFVRFTGLMLRQLKQMVGMGILQEQTLKDVSNELSGPKAKSRNKKSK